MRLIGVAATALCATVVFLAAPAPSRIAAQERSAPSELDKKVEAFLESRSGRWHDMNVSERDGRILYDLVLKHRYTRALEIGTSTGHSGIWIAWALSKTGGKLTTIEIDEERHRLAVENFQKAGLADFVDARLADAHELVAGLPGPFDFVFCDADKDWYPKYLKDAWPKIVPGGCFAAHNVRNGMYGIRDFLAYARSLPDARTTIDESSWSGISLTIKQPSR